MIAEVIKHTKLSENDVFVDLGSGESYTCNIHCVRTTCTFTYTCTCKLLRAAVYIQLEGIETMVIHVHVTWQLKVNIAVA